MQIKKYCCGAGTLFKIVKFIYKKRTSVEGLRSGARTKKSGAIMLLTYPSGHMAVVVNVSLMCVYKMGGEVWREGCGPGTVPGLLSFLSSEFVSQAS